MLALYTAKTLALSGLASVLVAEIIRWLLRKRK